MSYLVGFFDGEGNIGTYAGGGTGRTLRVQITQNRSPKVDRIFYNLRDKYDGAICELKRESRRCAYIYQTSGCGAASLLRDMLPYLVLKRDQADLALLWFDNRPPRMRDDKGRLLRRDPRDVDLSKRVSDLLKEMKRSNNYEEDLVEIKHELRQVLNVKGD
jgi:hypothetical protein